MILGAPGSGKTLLGTHFVATVFSMETRDLFVPTLDVPVDDLWAIVETIIFLRYAERRFDVHRLISILKLRESEYDPASVCSRSTTRA